MKLFSQELKDLNCFDAFRSTPLHYASQRGQFEIVKYLIDEVKILAESKNNFLQTPLHEAVGHGYFNIVEILVPKMSDISTEDIDGKTPLDYATEGGYYKIVNFLKARSAKQGQFSSIVNKNMILGFYVGKTQPEV